MTSIAPHQTTALAENFRWACLLDVTVRKPGNVSLGSPGHGMSAEQFLASANAAAPMLCASGLRVGERIERATIATLAAAGCNTNLGILLLCAPIAAAMQRVAERETQLCLDPTTCVPPAGRPPTPETALRGALQAVLYQLDADDAAAAFRAIAIANPGGLGESPEQDVRNDPTVDLRMAMAIAAPRDRIALQYITDFDDLFDPALADFMDALGEPPSPARLAAAVEDVFFGFLMRFSDSHIFRKYGPSLAQSVTQQAREWRRRWGSAAQAADDDTVRRAVRAQALAQWDAQLKAAGINPGTSADLTVATAFLAACLDPRLRALHPVDEMAWKMHFR